MYAFLLYSYILELLQHFSKARWIHKRAYKFIPTFFFCFDFKSKFYLFIFLICGIFITALFCFLFFCSVYVFQIVTCLKYFSWREIIYLNQCVVCLWCVSFPYITMCWKKDWLGGMSIYYLFFERGGGWLNWETLFGWFAVVQQNFHNFF